MAVCEMCGYNGDLKPAIVEGTMLDLCSKCLRYGDAIEVKRPTASVVEQRLKTKRTWYGSRAPTPLRSTDSEEIIVADFAHRVKNARQKSGKKQEDIAKAIAEKLSVLQKVESGALEPPMKLAKKLEQYLRITLIEKETTVEKETIREFDAKDSGVTIGDFIKRKN